MKFLNRAVCLGCDEPLGRDEQNDDLCFWCRTSLPGWDDSRQDVCPVCGQKNLSEEGLCCDCRAQNWAFSSMMGLTPYRLGPGHWTAVYKKEPRPRLAKVLAERFFWDDGPPAILVPVPPHARHKRQRGWDPVLKLAKVLSKKTGWPLVCALRRRPTVSQKSLYRAERFINAEKSYFLTGESVKQKVCWLVDDVVTTGATVQTCAALLKTAGAREVRILCLALH